MDKLSLFSDINKVRGRVENPPKDAVAEVGSDVKFNCTVNSMTSQDNLIWLHRHIDSLNYTKLFESNPPAGSSVTSRLKGIHVEIEGTYNLVVRQVSPLYSGEFLCSLVNLQNYSAQLTVAGRKETAHYFFILRICLFCFEL